MLNERIIFKDYFIFKNESFYNFLNSRMLENLGVYLFF